MGKPPARAIASVLLTFIGCRRDPRRTTRGKPPASRRAASPRVRARLKQHPGGPLASVQASLLRSVYPRVAPEYPAVLAGDRIRVCPQLLRQRDGNVLDDACRRS